MLLLLVASDVTVAVIIALLSISLFVVGGDIDNDGTPSYQEVEGATNPFLADSDLDGLTDSQEKELGTSPVRPDADKDGLNDGLEVRSPEPISDADPLHKDLYIEVDRANGTDIPREQFASIKRSFRTAPVENPDGKTGFRVHYSFGDKPVETTNKVSINEYFDSYHEDTDVFERRGEAHYHILIVENVAIQGFENSSAVVGGTIEGEDGMIVQASENNNETGATAMHELGHAIGLNSNDYRGIDSFAVSEEAYPSVMNYNYRDDCSEETEDTPECPSPFRFSSSDSSFDDWEHIESNGVRGPETWRLA